MPYLSLIVPTMRAGGLDILFDSLAAQTFTDFELVLVDGLYEKRRDLVQQEAKDRFLCVRHVGMTPNPFPNCAFCAYSNAGIVGSTGEILVFAVDYSRLPPDLLARHAAFHKADTTKKAGMMGPHLYQPLTRSPEFPVYGRADVDKYEADVKAGRLDRFMFSLGEGVTDPAGGHQADGGVTVPADCDPKLRMPAGPIGPDYFHAKNESVRREHVLAIGGWDTDLDGAHLYQDSDFADRLTAKAGVKWTLDPAAINHIINPRHIFPFARRQREHQENFMIWQRKKAEGYPPRQQKLEHIEVLEKPERVQRVDVIPVEPQARKLRIAMIYGEFCKPAEPFDPPGLYTRTGLTGSESAFFNAAIGLAERGHEVVTFCKCKDPYDHPSGLTVLPLAALHGLRQIQGLAAVIAWNEPDYLKFAPQNVLKITEQQINDWAYCREPEWSKVPDVYVFPSQETLMFHRNGGGLGTQYPVRQDARFYAIPNSCNLEHFRQSVERHPHRAVWASSADRGLHHLLDIWPDIRRRIPDAELRIFYEIDCLLERVKHGDDPAGRRARYIAAAVPKLKSLGVTVVGPVDNLTMAKEYASAAVLPYTFDPLRHTETFGCTVLDACAGGCVPVVSAYDCLPSVHGRAALVIDEHPGRARDRWVNTVCDLFERGASKEQLEAMKQHAVSHDRAIVAEKWEQLIVGSL